MPNSCPIYSADIQICYVFRLSVPFPPPFRNYGLATLKHSDNIIVNCVIYSFVILRQDAVNALICDMVVKD